MPLKNLKSQFDFPFDIVYLNTASFLPAFKSIEIAGLDAVKRKRRLDALVCTGYKWLFGPYGCAYAYYGDYFYEGKPIEQYWSIRLGSEYLANLTQYQSEYKPLAQRYAPGESASFIFLKMQAAALKEILNINAQNLQDYCHSISKNALEKFKELGFYSDARELRAKHLFGIKIPKSVDLERLKHLLKTANITVAFRGDYIRVSCHLFNTKAHFKKLVKVKSLVTQ